MVVDDRQTELQMSATQYTQKSTNRSRPPGNVQELVKQQVAHSGPLPVLEERDTITLFSKKLENLHKLHKQQRKEFGRKYEQIIQANFGIGALAKEAHSPLHYRQTPLDKAIVAQQMIPQRAADAYSPAALTR